MTRTYTVHNKAGMYMEKCCSLVQCANNFEADIKILFNDHKIDCKSILGLLSLCISYQEQFAVEAEGNDANEALKSIDGLFELEG